MIRIGFVTEGFSDFDDDVFDVLNVLAKKYGLEDGVELYSTEAFDTENPKPILDNLGLDFWFFVPAMALAGANINGHIPESTDAPSEYEIVISDDDNIMDFCKRLCNIEPFYLSAP